MKQRWRRPVAIALATVAALAIAVAPVSAAGTTNISGTGLFDDGGACPAPPSGFESYTDFTLVMSGDLSGCWYTDVDVARFQDGSGTYKEYGREVFVATDGSMFETNYQFSAKFAPSGEEIHGRCQHVIVAGSGVDAFSGMAGRVDFKDDVETGIFHYRGHLTPLN
jgi:hypothetical protein